MAARLRRDSRLRFHADHGTVQRAETDWPEKKADLETRLASLKSVQARGEQVWQSSADLRREAAANDYAHLNFGALGGDADALHTAAADLPQKSASLTTLSGQLYTSWDKLLVDMEERGHGKSKTYDQEIRTVTTRVPDAASKSGATTSDERWVDVPQADLRSHAQRSRHGDRAQGRRQVR